MTNVSSFSGFIDLIPHNYGNIKKINNMYRSTLHSDYLESDSYLCNSLMDCVCFSYLIPMTFVTHMN